MLRSWLKQKFRFNPLNLSLMNKNLNSLMLSNGNGKRILFSLLELSHYQAVHLAYLSRFLSKNGYKVSVLLCDGTLKNCEIRSAKNDNKKINICKACQEGRRQIYFNCKEIEILEISDKKLNECLPVKNIKPSIDDPVVYETAIRYYFGDEKKAMSDINLRKSLSIQYQQSKKFSNNLNKIVKPDLVIGNMLDYIYFRELNGLFLKLGIFRQITMTDYSSYHCIIDEHSLYPAKKRFEKFVSQNGELSETQSYNLKRILKNRITGKNESSQRYNFRNTFAEKIEKTLEIDKSKKNVFIFPNLHWDAGIGSWNKIFNDVIDWVGLTIENLADCQNVNVYIKPHPEEIFRKGSSGFGVLDAAKARGYKVQSAKIINNEMGLNPTSLSSVIDIAIINSGTVGLELMHLGVPVINVGITSYSETELEFSFDNAKEYFNFLRSSDSVPPSIDSNKLEQYLYFYFIYSLTYWPFTKKFRGDEFFNLRPINKKNSVYIKKFFNKLLN